MSPRKSVKKSDDNPSAEVDAFMQKLAHPLKPVLEAVRKLILCADKQIVEGIKWNAPSFRVAEYFATTNIRKDSVLVILHLGAKVKDKSFEGMRIDDPDRLLKWLGKDRCVVSFPDLGSVRKQKAAMQAVIRQWISYLE